MREAAKKDEREVGRKEGRKAGKMGVLKRKECKEKRRGEQSSRGERTGLEEERIEEGKEYGRTKIGKRMKK